MPPSGRKAPLSQPSPTSRKKSSTGRLIQAVLAVVVVGAVFIFVLPQIADYGEVWAVIRRMTWLELATLTALAGWNQVTYWLVEMSGRPGLGYRQALKITHTSTALSNILPGGAALGAGLQATMYRSYGFAPGDIAISLTATGIWNTFVKLGMPVVALALLAIGGDTAAGLVVAAVIGVVILIGAILAFAAILASERWAIWIGERFSLAAGVILRRFGKPAPGDWGRSAAGFRRRTIDLLRDRWISLTLTAAVSHSSLFLVLLVALRHVGVAEQEVAWTQVFASFAFVRLLSAIPITPGGLGVVELGLSATLIAAGGAEAGVVAAILVYRLLTFVVPIPIGALTYVAWRREIARRNTREAEAVSTP